MINLSKKNREMLNKFLAFSLAEGLICLAILAAVTVAFAPTVTRKISQVIDLKPMQTEMNKVVKTIQKNLGCAGIAYCKEFKEETCECTKCESGYKLIDGKCENCDGIRDCKSYYSEDNICKCQMCKNGYIPSVNKHGEQICSQCEDPDGCCLEFDTSDNTCNCMKCKSGCNRIGNTCKKNSCENDIANCQEYTEDCKCKNCIPGYDLLNDGQKCSKCSNPTDIASCPNSYEHVSGTSICRCTSCDKPGYTIQGNVCKRDLSFCTPSNGYVKLRLGHGNTYCVTNHNIGDGPIGSGYNLSEVQSYATFTPAGTTCNGAHQNCCWYSKAVTSGDRYYTAYYGNCSHYRNGNYSGCYRTVCNYKAAETLCANLKVNGSTGFRLMDLSDYRNIKIGTHSAGKGQDGLMLCSQLGYSDDWDGCKGSRNNCHGSGWGEKGWGKIGRYSTGFYINSCDPRALWTSVNDTQMRVAAYGKYCAADLYSYSGGYYNWYLACYNPNHSAYSVRCMIDVTDSI